jgi:hypothetical protein
MYERKLGRTVFKLVFTKVVCQLLRPSILNEYTILLRLVFQILSEELRDIIIRFKIPNLILLERAIIFIPCSI